MRLQSGIAILIAVSFFIFGYTVFAPSSLSAFWSLQRKKEYLETQISLLEKQVLNQKEKILLLSGDSQESRFYLERIARREYGFIGKEESLLIFSKK